MYFLPLLETLEKGGRAVVELLVQIIMARLLVPEEFGALAIMLVFVNVGNVIVQSGLNTALVQVPDVGGRDCSTVFWLSLGVSLVLYVAVFACAPLFASFYAMPHIVWPLRALALVLVVNSFNAVQVAIVQRALEFRKVFNATIASVAVSGVLGVASALAGAGLWALVVQQLAYQIANCAALALQVRWRPRAIFDAGRAWRLFSFGWKLLASGLLDQGYQSLSDLIIGKQFSAGSLGWCLRARSTRWPWVPCSTGRYSRSCCRRCLACRTTSPASSVSSAVRSRPRPTSSCPRWLPSRLWLSRWCVCFLGSSGLGCVPFLQMYCFVYALLPIHTTNLQAINGVGPQRPVPRASSLSRRPTVWL